MDNKKEPKKEQPNTYFVQDRTNEMQRLEGQDHLFTRIMGGVLSEQPDTRKFKRVLDVGCGTGNWLIETALTYPEIPHLIGVDISGMMLEYARTRAEEAGVGDRITFLVMDALLMLEFPSAHFDLVNQRLGMSYLRTWDWTKLLQEYKRVSRKGGTIRVTEAGGVWSTMPASIQFSNLLTKAFHQSGHLPQLTRNSLIDQLDAILLRYVPKIQASLYPIEYRAGTPDGDAFLENGKKLLPGLRPFILKWTNARQEEYDTIAQNCLAEMRHPDYVGSFSIKTVWGTV